VSRYGVVQHKWLYGPGRGPEQILVSWVVSPPRGAGRPRGIPGHSTRLAPSGRRRRSQAAYESADEREGLPVFPRVEQCEPLAENSWQSPSRSPDGQHRAFIQCSIQLLDNRSRYGALFGEDSWKAAPSLTINFGLRWDVARLWSDVYDRVTTPVPGVQSVRFPNSPLGNLVPGDPGVPSTVSPTRWRNFGPRLGIAYAPSGGLWGAAGKTSIRAAFGLYYLGVADNGYFGILGDAPWGLYWNSSQPPDFASPYITRANGVSQGQKFPFTFPSGPGPVSKLRIRQPHAALRARLLQQKQDRHGPAF
jgi:hypothetical protein